MPRLCLLIVSFIVICSAILASAPPSHVQGAYLATAYSVTGITASGEWTHRHVVAADPELLPLGTRLKIKRAGRYSGEYVVADTGEKVQGRKLDIYMPNTTECKKFGKKRVKVQVLELGNGTQTATKEADQVVKTEVAKDVAKGVVGNAATEVDWNSKGAATAKAIQTGQPLPAPKTDEKPAPPPQ